MAIAAGTAVKVRSTGQNGRVIAVQEREVSVRLSLDKDNPSADWASLAIDEVEELEEPE
jgi:hypothetical protein